MYMYTKITSSYYYLLHNKNSLSYQKHLSAICLNNMFSLLQGSNSLELICKINKSLLLACQDYRYSLLLGLVRDVQRGLTALWMTFTTYAFASLYTFCTFSLYDSFLLLVSSLTLRVPPCLARLTSVFFSLSFFFGPSHTFFFIRK